MTLHVICSPAQLFAPELRNCSRLGFIEVLALALPLAQRHPGCAMEQLVAYGEQLRVEHSAKLQQEVDAAHALEMRSGAGFWWVLANRPEFDIACLPCEGRSKAFSSLVVAFGDGRVGVGRKPRR